MKQEMKSQMNMDKHRLVPKLRFPEFKDAGDWVEKPLGKVASKQIKKNKNSKICLVLTNSATQGIIPQRDYFDKNIANLSNLTGYYIVDVNDFVYNPRISVTAPVGPIKRNHIGLGIMSPLYTVFSFNYGEKTFFEFFFETSSWHDYLKKISNHGARHDRMSIKDNDFFRMPIPFPSPFEQQKIADCLSSLDEVITLHTQKLDTLKEHKKGLMQQLFPAEGENIPKLRFPEFKDAGDWVEKPLGANCSITTGKLDANAMIDNGKYRFYTCAKDYYFIDVYAFDTEALLISGNGANVGYIHYYKGKFNAYQRTYILDAFSQNIIYIKYCLEQNLHRRIATEKKDGNTPYIVMSTLTDMLIKLPPDPKEQQKIADCLSSLDEVITAQTEKIEALKEHKKGLMQQLFPE